MTNANQIYTMNLIIGKRDYAVTKGQRDNYVLVGRRGGLYGTVRHAFRADAMFVVSLRGSRSRLAGAWLSDLGGSLAVISGGAVIGKATP